MRRGRQVEETLILHASRNTLGAGSKREIEYLCAQNPDWEYIADRSPYEGVSGLLYRTFSRQVPGQAPESTMKFLRGEYAVTVAENLAICAELDRLLDMLEERGVPVLLLPGTTLLPLYDLGCRPMSDVDLLVRPTDLRNIERCLGELGYAAPAAYPLVFSKNEVTFDVHIDPLNTARIQSRAHAIGMSADDIWRSARGWRGPEDHARAMSPEDTFIYLCAHLVKHSFSRLIWFIDLHQLVSAGDLPHGKILMERARSFNLDRSVAYCVFYLKRSMGLSIEGMEERKLSAVERCILRGMLANRELGRFGDLLFMLSVRDVRHRAELLWETCFPKAHVMEQVFPNIRSRVPRGVYLLRLGQVFGYTLAGFSRLMWAMMRSIGSSPSEGP